MVDHGKRSGIEHFVKVISWAGKDDDGNRVIKHFCLDVDKSSHSAVGCANATKTSLNKLEMAGLDLSTIIIHVITGDTGGGGTVQHIHGKLIEIKVMSKDSKEFNCQFHAQNKGLENACTKTFGKHGIGQCNVFQAAYVYVKMIKQLHEVGGAEIVDTVHKLLLKN